jgi:ABC-type polar amino acid transport system ATPase subunit
MIKIKNLSFKYSKGKLALDDVSATFPKEHILAILGESGSGKTTLLRLIGRFLKPTSGEILFDNKNIRNISEQELRKKVGIVFQDLYLFPHLSVMENLTIAPAKVLDIDLHTAQGNAAEIMVRLGISDLAGSYPSQISGGQAQRVAIARSLMMKPEYLLLDEPTSALDMNTTREFGEWLLELKINTTFIVVTHDVPFAKMVASSGIWLTDGQLTAHGSIECILDTVGGNC